MTTFIHPGPSGSVSNDCNWQDFFGEPRGPIAQNAYSAFPRETLHLPEVYKVPEEGVSRLVTQQVSEHRDHFVRYGLAFMIEHGFMKTPKGRMTYKANLEQIRDAILQSLYISVIEGLLRCKTSSQLFAQCYGKALTVATARKRLKLEVESFAEIQKSEHGDVGTGRVLDDGVKKYIAGVRRENFDYYLKGPSGPKLYAENQGVGDPKSLDVAANCLIFECKSFNIPGYDDPVNITSRRKTIGEVMVSFPHVDVRERYTSAQRDVLAYDEDRDGFRKLSIREGLLNCCRFDHESGAPTFPDKIEGTDMFKRDDETLKYLGQMTASDLPEDAIRDWISSVVAKIDDASEVASGLNVLRSLVKKLDGAPTDKTDAGVKAYFGVIKMAYGTATEGSALDTDTRVPVLTYDKMNVDVDRKTKMIPYGYGTYAGLKELAKDKYADPDYSAVPRDYHDEAKIAIKAFDALFERIESVCAGNVFVSAPPFFVERHASRAAVFFNVVHERLPPIVVNTNIEAYKFESLGTHYTGKLDALLELGVGKVSAPEEQTRGVKGAIAAKIEDIFATAKSAEEAFKQFVYHRQDKGETEGLWELILSDKLKDHSRHEICKALESATPTTSVADFEKALDQTHEPKAATSSGAGDEKDIVTQLTCSDALRKVMGGDGIEGCKPYGEQEKAMAIGAGAFDYGEASISFGMRQSRKRDRAAAKGGSGSTNPADPNFFKRDVVDDHVMKSRLDKCDRSFASPLQRALAKMFLGTPINHHALQAFIDADCVFPFNIGDNVIQKLHVGNFTFYSKSLVYRQQNVYLAEDMFSTSYVSGAGTAFFTCAEDYEAYCSGTARSDAKSIFALLAPYSSREYANPMDLTGKYGGNIAALQETSEYHYATAPFYQAHWGWRSPTPDAPGRVHFDNGECTPNTLVFQGHQSMYNPSNGMYDLVIKNTGHWGDRVYPGCGKVRTGMAKLLEPVYYSNVYGGGGDLSAFGK